MSQNSQDSTKQSDTLLWLAGAVVVGLGVTWLLMSKPWSGEAAARPDVAGSQSAPAEQAPRPPPLADAQAELETSLDQNPLRMARLAHEAGMLVEPEEYSAWALYRIALEQKPDNAEAKKGLETIAEELLRRASAAVEQGRFDDARATIERIRSAIPVHPGANELQFRINELAPRQVELARPAQPSIARESAATSEGNVEAEAVDGAPPESEPEPAVAATEPEPALEVDPAVAAHEAFTAAMAANRLLTPLNGSAKHFVEALSSTAPDHPLTEQAKSTLFAEFVSRADGAIASLDADAAGTWIDEADSLGVDAATIARLHRNLRSRLIEAESAKRLPASELDVVHYEAPEYPVRALERELEGWVDLEFTVGLDGTTRDIVVTDASHNTFFRNEAVEAVSGWQFEPRVFMNETIEQHSYTRIVFAFE